MRRTGTFLVLLVLTAGLAACGGGADGGMDQDTASMEETAEAAAGQEMGETDGTVPLAAKNQSGITGTATVRSAGDSLGVEVSFEGLTEGETYPVHLHLGSCSAGGGVAAPIGEVTGGADGTGSTSTRIARAGLSADTTYFVQGHLPSGQPAVCGDAPAVSELLRAAGSGGGGA